MTTELSNDNLMDATINNINSNEDVPETSSDVPSAGIKRKISTADDLNKAVSSPPAADAKPTGRTLSHSVSLTGIDVFDTAYKGREEYASDIPKNAVNVCSASFGAKVLFATDEWFAKADNLLKDDEPLFDEDAYCEQGKVMDGWESRRRREEGHDWCLIQLGVPYWTSAAPLRDTSPTSKLQLVGIELDTAHFTGNHTPQVSIELAKGVTNPLSIIQELPQGVERLLTGGRQGTGHSPTEVAQAQHAISGLAFETLLPQTSLRPGHETTRYHYFPMDTPIDLSWDKKDSAWVKLNYFPDGGVARMRFWAVEVMDDNKEPAAKKQKPNVETVSLYMPITTGPICTVVPHGSVPFGEMPSQTLTLKEISSDENGGKGVACSNKHYGEPWRLVQSTSGQGMWDGWETARHSHRPLIVEQDPVTKLSKTPLNDWAILKLGSVCDSNIQSIVLDTKHFLGNYPESILLEGCHCETAQEEEDEESYWKSDASSKVEWFPLVARTRMSPNSEHWFAKEQLQNTDQPMTHVRLSIYPDGGCSRVRIYV